MTTEKGVHAALAAKYHDPTESRELMVIKCARAQQRDEKKAKTAK